MTCFLGLYHYWYRALRLIWTHNKENLLEAGFQPLRHIDQNKNQNRSKVKIQNRVKERRQICKHSCQDSGGSNFSYARCAENFLPKFIEICMETPCWCPPRWQQQQHLWWAPTWPPETKRNICHWVSALQKRGIFSRGTQ